MIKTCIVCGKQFEDIERGNRRKVCSAECQVQNSWQHTEYGIMIGFWIQVDPSTVGQCNSFLNAFEDDILYGEERDEHNNIISSWKYIIKYNTRKGRMMLLDYAGNWEEVDNINFDKVIGNIHDNPELLEVEE